MKQFLLTMAGVVAGLTIFFVGLPMLFILAAMSSSKPVPPATVLELDLRKSIGDQEPQTALAVFGRHSLSVMSIVQTLRRAEGDPRVKGLLIRLPEDGLSPGEADELRLAVKHFRGSNKPVIPYSQGLAPSGASPSTYMLGASTGQMWMQGGATFEAPGIASEEMFFKRLFDKYGVKANYEQRYEYKNAVNPYLYDDYTPAHREATLSWMGSVYADAVANAAADRKKDPTALRQSMEAGPHDAAEALQLGLIDKVGQLKEAEDSLLHSAGSGAKLQDFGDYLSSVKGLDGASGANIAVVYAEGDIMTGSNDSGSLLGNQQNIYSDDVSKAIYDAIDDKEIKAIVFRVSSPGGEDTASEQILAAVRAAKAAGKPVVVSMGEYGASGGYWISSQASAIVAEPGTLTGSIGVYGGKLALGDTFAHFGVDLRQLSVGGPDAGAYSLGQSFTPQQRAAFSHSIDLVYDGFVQRVSSGRNLPVERVREIAKGRVWTGAQARALGLVDQVGGFYDAVDKAKALAGIKGEAKLRRMTTAESAFGALFHAMGADASAAVRALVTMGHALSDPKVQGLMAEAHVVGLGPRGADVLAPVPMSWR